MYRSKYLAKIQRRAPIEGPAKKIVYKADVVAPMTGFGLPPLQQSAGLAALQQQSQHRNSLTSGLFGISNAFFGQ